MGSEPLPLHLRTWGAGDRTLLLLHGITTSGEGWWRVGEALAADGWRVVAPDLRGHGASPRASSYRFADHVADLGALGGRWDAVVGLSMGAALAVVAAGADPAWAGGLILLDPALLMPPDRDEVLRWLLDDFTRPATADRLLAENPRWSRRDAEIKAAELIAVGTEVVTATVADNWPWMLLDEAAALRVPTVVIGSDPAAGGVLPVAIGEWLAATNPCVEYRLLPGSSHSAHRDSDSWETYRSTLADALGRLPTLECH